MELHTSRVFRAIDIATGSHTAWATLTRIRISLDSNPSQSLSCLPANTHPRCNPELLTSLAHKLGLSQALAFTDVFSLTDLDLLSLLPRPALALLLVFPVSPSYEAHRLTEDAPLPAYTASGPTEDPVWFKQTIKNACGLIGLLHAMTNGAARDQIVLGSDLDKLLVKARPLGPEERARVLEESRELEEVHREAAQLGDTEAPAAEDEVELHYVAFVKSGGKLWELDGRRKGPLQRGALGENEDLLSELPREVVQGFVERERESGRLDFSVVALVPSLD